MGRPRKKRTDLYAWSTALKLFRSTGARSILERTPDRWKTELRAGSRSGAVPVELFLTWGHEQVDLLFNGSGWDREYPEDVWRLSRVGHPEYPKRTISFTEIRPAWLRDLAKRWLRRRITLGYSVKTVSLDHHSLRHFSEYLAARPDAPSSASELTREHLESWVVTVAMQFAGVSTQHHFLSSVKAMLLDAHQFEWCPSRSLPLKSCPQPVGS